MKSLTPASQPDAFLKEIEMAVALNQIGELAICPLLLGANSYDAKGPTFTPFDTNNFKLSDFPSRPSPTSGAFVKDTLSHILQFQGILMESALLTSENVADIVTWCDDNAWTSNNQNQFKVRCSSFSF